MSSAITELQARGFVLHPLKGKIPLLSGWQKLTQTPSNIEAHFENGGNVGAVCGKVSNVTVIDLDSFLFASDAFGAGVETLKACRTEGRGHIYFKYNPDLPASKHHDLGIEVLSDGNNIVVPPSVHPSGDLYQWKNPNTPILEMSAEIETKLLYLFKTEAELKQILAKCRHCFRTVIKKKPDMHGAEGREYMLAVSTDMKAGGATETHIRMFAKLMYDTKYDEGRTLQEWRNIDPAKTWTCDVLRAKLPAYVDLQECEKCEERKKKYQDAPRIIDPADNTDVGNARRLVTLFGDNIRYCHPWKSWLCWNDKIWERDNTGQIFRYAKEMAENMKAEADSMGANAERDRLYKHATASKSSTKIKATVFLAESEPGISITPEDLDKNKMLFSVQNGTIELESGVLREHRREDYITKISPASYDPTALNPKWRTFLDRITNNDIGLEKYLQSLSGQLLTGEVREKALYVFYGKKDTGKTTFVEAIAHILGEFAETMPIESLMKKTRGAIPNDIAALRGKRFVFVDEPNFGDKLSEGLIKKLTGLDTINARFLNQEFFKFKPEFKLVISSNNRPDITDKDQAIWGRVKCVPFLAKIPKNEQDQTLQRKLEDESPGILNWMLSGCLNYQREGMLIPEVVAKATEDYKEDMDTLSDFFNLCCIVGEEYKLPHEYLYTAFRLWALSVGRKPMSKKAFTQVTVNRDFDTTDTIFVGKRRCRGFVGITLTDWMITSVHRFLTSPDDEKDIVRTVVTDLNEKTGRSLLASHVCENKMCSKRSICSCIANLCILQSVQSVQSVQENILNILKKEYNNIPKPQSNIHLEKLKDQMETHIMENSEFDEQEDISRIVEDYCHARGWS